MRRLIPFLVAIAIMLVGALPAVADGTLPEPVELGQFTKDGTYLIRFAEPPVVAYDGGINGLAATRPAAGQKINPTSARVQSYANFLAGRQTDALSRVGARDQKIYSYVYSLNGVAANLTAQQANELSHLDGVLSVEEDVLMHVDTNRTPTMLGLDAPNGLWNAVGGVGDAGENVIVGIIDTGIWPENPSFANQVRNDRTGRGPAQYRMLRNWWGKCQPGEQFSPLTCDGKIVGAQWFNSGFGGDAAVRAEFDDEYISARDSDGHGSHTASTAAGNYGVDAVIDGQNLGKISGMAPRARIAVYKVCWGGDAGGCYGSDSVAAIDTAVRDGVDVLNFSISGTGANYLDAVEVAFLFAADAGVFVAASAGNSGPAASTVAHPSPWLTTVAAGTKDDDYPGSVTLGNNATYQGKSRTLGVGPAPLVYAGNVAANGWTAADAALCYIGSLDPAAVAGKIVLCDRGVIARTDKSLAVKQAGGAGMILANTSPSSVNADMHFVPTVHVDEVARAAIMAYITAQGSGATAKLTPGTPTIVNTAPNVATFSSRGPNQAGGDLLKPDIMAPGEDILAAVSPTGNNGRNFDFLSGTSMSSPHIAGIGALMKDAHPTWSPAAIKSALMTTATTQRKDGSAIAGGPFDYGAGEVVPNNAVNPGLVYDANIDDYLGFICGAGQLSTAFCDSNGIPVLDPSDLNYPSISIGALAGIQTVTRTVTNVGPASTYSVSVNAPAGVNVQVNPSSMYLGRGQSATYTVTFTVTTAALNAYANGSLTWSDGARSVRSPLVVQPVALAAPAEISAAGTSGSASFAVGFGYTGAYEARAHGMFAATKAPGTVLDDPDNDITVGLGPGKVGITVHPVVLPAGTKYARFSLFDDYTDGDDDLDLYVFL
ncbi:MAG TPA: S8 family peptidase, partial [Thermomicrobiales bacterium]|nr:S8 family peptidase [Thermomicrobiales bacterium]